MTTFSESIEKRKNKEKDLYLGVGGKESLTEESFMSKHCPRQRQTHTVYVALCVSKPGPCQTDMSRVAPEPDSRPPSSRPLVNTIKPVPVKYRQS